MKANQGFFKLSVVLNLHAAQAAVRLANMVRVAQSVPSQEQNSVQMNMS
jgi:hypothetical protein